MLLIETIDWLLACVLMNLGCTIGYFRTHQAGWYNGFEPVMMTLVFVGAGVVWALIVLVLNLLCGRYVKST